MEFDSWNRKKAVLSDPAKRAEMNFFVSNAGNDEYQVLNAPMKPRKIVTACPHCFRYI
jgi:hypothetical protein